MKINRCARDARGEKRFEMEYDGKPLVVETGRLAPQAGASVLISHGGQVVHVAATMGGEKPHLGFFPLTVDYEEKHYAIGKIPGSFFRREGRPTERAVLACRLIDRSIRPLFPDHMRREVQIVATPFLTPQESNPSWLAMLGTAIALEISNIPFPSGLVPIRLGRKEGEVIKNPQYADGGIEGDIDLFIAYNNDHVMMIECQGAEITDEEFLEIEKIGHERSRPLLTFIAKIKAAVGKEKSVIPPPKAIESLLPADVLDELSARYKEAYVSDISKGEFQTTWWDLVENTVKKVADDDSEKASTIRSELRGYEKKWVRHFVLGEGVRRGGRAAEDVRLIDAQKGLVEGQHGSSLFQRGGTQVVSFLTLGAPGDKQRIDDLSPIDEKRFMHHYNFPPYSVGEARFMRGPGRREIGHGALVAKALGPVLPSEENFPYTIRVVSECIASNGSTSMGATCATTIALMDGGVPLKAPVAGISIGLMTDDTQAVLLNDIEGIEDFFGEMDFKVAGTTKGITAIQVDVKGGGICRDLLPQILSQAKDVRLGLIEIIEDEMEGDVKMSPYAPRIVRKEIQKDQISTIIGPGGKMIRGIQADCGVQVDVDEDVERGVGIVHVTAPDEASMNTAVDRINALFRKAEAGETYTGPITSIREFGLFVRLFGSTDGLVHISEVDKQGRGRLSERDLKEMYSEGDEITVFVKEIRRDGKVSLTMPKKRD
ncbi:polyribonucleotide nucleotidyltransferase [bacterium]|nr:polyribonucleotide nucleotidyltransferase [bacterium]